MPYSVSNNVTIISLKNFIPECVVINYNQEITTYPTRRGRNIFHISSLCPFKILVVLKIPISGNCLFDLFSFLFATSIYI